MSLSSPSSEQQASNKNMRIAFFVFLVFDAIAFILVAMMMGSSPETPESATSIPPAEQVDAGVVPN